VRSRESVSSIGPLWKREEPAHVGTTYRCSRDFGESIVSDFEIKKSPHGNRSSHEGRFERFLVYLTFNQYY